MAERTYGVNQGIEKCQRVRGPSFCDDVRIQRDLNISLLACDPSMPYRNFAASVFDESKMKEDGALWLYDLNKNFSGPFHPSGISFAPTTKDGATTRVVVLVVNHVPFKIPRVEVLYYYPARKSLVYKKIILNDHFFAASKISASSVDAHQLDDTPSFFLSNDHGYNITDWKRNYEDRYNLPASTIVYYNARADMAREVGSRMWMPTGIVAGYDDSLWVAQAKAGTVDYYYSDPVLVEHPEQALAVDTREPNTIEWPDMKHERIRNTKQFNVGIDYDPSLDTLVIVSHANWKRHVQYAKDRLKGKKTNKAKGGFVISRALELGRRMPYDQPKQWYAIIFEPLISHDGSAFGSPSAIAAWDDRVLVTGQYENSFLDCDLGKPDFNKDLWLYAARFQEHQPSFFKNILQHFSL
ncbi:hypothetical protein BGZ94_007840 [Podila epigama]|nr:hypothetical protein BGZ94_007840 [Podila epigama]